VAETAEHNSCVSAVSFLFMKITNESRSKLEVFLPDTRGVTISRWGKGNLKIGPNVVTYSKIADVTCPGATSWCREHCYAKRIGEPVASVHLTNTELGCLVPELPIGTRLVRMHVSGDFDTVQYIQRWTQLAAWNLGVTFWAYTRSWRVPELLPDLEKLRAMPNVQLFASMDESTKDEPPAGWRKAWIEGDPRAKGLVCPEERGKVENCEECGHCFKPRRPDVIFLRH